MQDMTNLISSHSTLLGSSALDFFNKTVGNPPMVFKMWMIIVLAVSFALFLILSALLIAVCVKEKKQNKATENKTQDNAEDNSEDIDNTVVENSDSVQAQNQDDSPVSSDTADEVDENNSNEDEVIEDNSNSNDEVLADTVAEESNYTANEETSDAVADEVADEVVENTEVQNSSSDEVTVDVADNEENNESASSEPDVTLINTNETVKEEEQNMENKEETNAKVVLGKLNYYLTESGYYFSLDANNGQQLFVSYSYTTQDGAMKGFETFAKAVLEGNFVVSEDKNGRFRYILNKKYQGPNYKTRVQCENAIASVKKFSQNYKVNVIEEDPEVQAQFAVYLENLKKAKDIDMDEIAKEEANTPKSGAFEIEEVDGGYRFYLYANNRQILYTSNIYASPVSARNGIDAFKKAVYGGVVVIEKDKFANYRYILRNSTTVTYAGESYDTEASAKKSFESVKRFVKSANIVPFKKKVDEDVAE